MSKPTTKYDNIIISNVGELDYPGLHDKDKIAIIRAIIHRESRGRPTVMSTISESALKRFKPLFPGQTFTRQEGAVGLMQLMPSTYAEMRHGSDRGKWPTRKKLVQELKDPSTNIQYGMKYYGKQLRTFKGNHTLALTAYNAGPARASKAMKMTSKAISAITYNDIRGHIPAETRGYIQEIVSNYTGSTSIGVTRPGATGPMSPEAPYVSTPSRMPRPGTYDPAWREEAAAPDFTPHYDDPTGTDLFKLGDVVLTVPPQNISVQESDTVYTVPVVRARGAPKIKTGQGNMMITVDCMFPRLVDINGYTDLDGRWYAGLRGIIAHYYRAPFVPLENSMVRSILMPEVDILTEESWEGGGHLGEYLATDVRVFEDLRERLAGEDGNETLVKYIANQINLITDTQRRLEVQRQKEEARRKEEGEKVTEMRFDDTPANVYEDTQLAVVLDSFSVSTVPGFPRALRATLNLLPFNYIPFTNDFSFLRTAEEAMQQAMDFTRLHEDPSADTTDIIPTYDISESSVFRRYYMALYEDIQEDPTSDVYPVNPGVPLLSAMSGDSSEITFKYKYTKETRLSLLRAQLNTAKIELKAVKELRGEMKVSDAPNWPWERVWRTICAYWSYMPKKRSHIRRLIRENLGIDDPDSIMWNPVDLKWSRVMEELEGTLADKGEAFIDLIDDIITSDINIMNLDPYVTGMVILGGDDAATTGITATFSNKLVPMKLVGQPYPTYQYMGTSDVNFTITVQTTREDLMAELRNMSMRSNYTQILKATMAGRKIEWEDSAAEVEGEFFELFGVRKVLITGVSYSTVDGQPGLYNVQISCVQADMDMKKYEALVGTKVVTEKIYRRAIELLAGPRHENWPIGSVWGNYSRNLIMHRKIISRIEGKWEKKEEELDREEKELQDELAKLPGDAWWAKVTRYFAEGAFSLGRKVFDAGTAVAKSIEEEPSLLGLYEVLQRIKVALGNPQLSSQLYDEELQAMLRRNREELDEKGNPCYADMGLPSLTDNDLDTPADFFFRRESIVTTDAITQELAVIDKYKVVQLEKAFRFNFENAEKEWAAIGREYDQFTEQLRSVYNDSAKVTTFSDLQSKFMRHGIQATSPAHVLEYAKNMFAAARSANLRRRISDMEGSMELFRERVTAIVEETHMNSKEKEKYIEGRMGRFDLELERLRGARAAIETPQGIVLTDPSDSRMVGDANWGYETAWSAAESKYIQTAALHARRKDQTLHMARAFPAIKLYFIEEDAEQWLLFDDFYAYSAIESVDIIKNRKSASDTAVIAVSNITGVLTDPIADYDREKIIKANLREEQSIDRLMLRVGCPIMIRMGYNNDPAKLDMEFLGAIAELSPGEGRVEIVAQGWAAQLNAPVTTNREHVGMWDWRKAHGDVVTWALDEIPGMKHFGKKSIFRRSNDVLRRDIGDIVLSRLTNMLLTTEMGDNNPRDDNIYLPYNSQWDPLTRPTFDWKIDEGQSAWEVIQEILLWYPDWIVTTLPYVPEPGRLSDQRLTLYVGPQDGYYKWTDKYDKDWEMYQEASRVPADLYQAGIPREGTTYLDREAAEEFGWKVVHTLSEEEAAAASKEQKEVKLKEKARRASSGWHNPEWASAQIRHWRMKIDRYITASVRGIRNKDTANKFKAYLTSVGVTDFDSHRKDNNSYIRWLSHNGQYKWDHPTKDQMLPLNSMTSRYVPTRIISGDCEDFANFNVNMARVYGVESYAVFALLGHSRGAVRGGHVFCVYRVPDGYNVLDIEKNYVYNAGTVVDAITAHGKVITMKLSAGGDTTLASKGSFVAAYIYDPDFNLKSTEILAVTTAVSVPTTTEAPKGFGDIPQARKSDKPDTSVTVPSRRDLFFKAGKLLPCFKPVIGHHFYDSDHHIVRNNIKASIDNMYNRVALAYPRSEPVYLSDIGKFNRSYEMVADDNINDDHIRTYVSYQKNIDTNWWANCFRPMILGKSAVSRGIRAITGIDEEDISPLHALPQYIRVANVILNNQVREMYTGELTVIGDPSVKPWDKVYLYDFENSMVGPFQVEQVIHHFSAKTGFVTTITPDLVTHCQNFQATLDTSYMNHIFAWCMVKGFVSPFMGLVSPAGAWYAKKAGAAIWGKVATQSMKAGLTKLGATKVAGVALGSAVPVVGWGILIGWTAYDIAKGIGLTFQKELGKLMGRQPISITPLTYYGKPLVAGLEGMRTDDIWVHLHDSITSIKDLPYELIAGTFKPGG